MVMRIREGFVLGWFRFLVCGIVLVFFRSFWMVVFDNFALGAALFVATMVISVFRRIFRDVVVSAVSYRFSFFFLVVIGCDCVLKVMEEARLSGLLPSLVQFIFIVPSG